MAAKISLCAVRVDNHALGRRKWLCNRSVKPAPGLCCCVWVTPFQCWLCTGALGHVLSHIVAIQIYLILWQPQNWRHQLMGARLWYDSHNRLLWLQWLSMSPDCQSKYLQYYQRTEASNSFEKRKKKRKKKKNVLFDLNNTSTENSCEKFKNGFGRTHKVSVLFFRNIIHVYGHFTEVLCFLVSSYC